MRRLGLGALVIGSAGGLLGVAACAASDAESVNPSNADGAAPEAGTKQDSGASDAGAQIEANAIVLVHAASFPAFRICFENASGDLPQPSTEVMPESNVVGVDVGTAVRFPPRSEMLGRAFVYLESYLRPLYTLEREGPTCGALLSGGTTKAAAIAVGEITTSLARGVHALVLGGCRDAISDPMASTARCGGDWDAATGNLRLRTIALPAYARADDTRLPVQLLQLSPSLDRSAAGRTLGVAFGSLDGGAASPPAPFVEGAVPFAVPVPNPPAQLTYTSNDLGSFATTGVFVTLGGPLGDGGAPVDAGGDSGARALVVAQSLAEIQRRSAPRSIPPDWFATAASYVLLSVGELDPRAADGGIDDDPRRALHLLAVPLATPDAGAADASP